MTKRRAGKLDNFQSYQRAIRDAAKRGGYRNIYSRAGMFNKYVKAKTSQIQREITKNRGEISDITAEKIIKFSQELKTELPKTGRKQTTITAEHYWKKDKKTGDEILVEKRGTRKEKTVTYSYGIDKKLEGMLDYVEKHPKAKNSKYIAESIMNTDTYKEVTGLRFHYWKFWALVDILEEYNLVYPGKTIKAYMDDMNPDVDEDIDKIADDIIKYDRANKKPFIRLASKSKAEIDF